MWESRVLSEISKSLWKPFCGFHRDVISIAVFVVGRLADVIETGIQGMRCLRRLPDSSCLRPS